MPYEAYAMMEEEVLLGALSGLITGIPGMLMGLLVYIFSSLSLYTIAKRRELKNPWLSWIPVGNAWILGSIADQYRYVMLGQTKSKRKVLLTLNLVNGICYVVFLVILVVMITSLISGAVMGMDERYFLRELVGSLGGMTALILPWMGVSIAYTVIRYMALYDLYASCDPQNKVLYLVVGIFFGAAEALFLFLCRNKDTGMPPRVDQQPRFREPQYQYQQYQYQQYQYQQPPYQAPQYQPPQYPQPPYQQPPQEPPVYPPEQSRQ